MTIQIMISEPDLTDEYENEIIEETPKEIK
jgi:hypothetical protein